MEAQIVLRQNRHIITTKEDKELSDWVWNEGVQKILRVNTVFMPHGDKIIAGLKNQPIINYNGFKSELGIINIEEMLKKSIHSHFIRYGQSEKYFENIWLMWWGMMSTDIKNGIFDTFKEIQNDKYTEDDMRNAILMAWDGSEDTQNIDDMIQSLSKAKTINIEVEICEEPTKFVGGNKCFETIKTVKIININK